MNKYIALSLAILVCLFAVCACDAFPAKITDQETSTEAQTPPESTPETTSDTAPESSTESATESVQESSTDTTPETEPPTPKKRVALTFDDGPSRQGLTEKIVDEFQKYNGRATFFVLGNLISSATGHSLAYAHENGFEIGIHGYTHDLYYDTCSEADFVSELESTKQAIESYMDAPITLLRPPGGRITAERALSSGYPIIMWSIDTEDWRYRGRADEATIQQNVDTIVKNALKNVEDGDIILMHEIYTNSYEATCIILKELSEMGFEFVTVTELIGEENLRAGSYVYSKNNIK